MCYFIYIYVHKDMTLSIFFRIDLIESMGKINKKVTTIFLPEMISAIDLLLATRNEAGISPSNEYLFPNYVEGHLNGWQTMNRLAVKAGCAQLNLISSTRLRQYLATVCLVSVFQLYNTYYNGWDWAIKLCHVTNTPIYIYINVFDTCILWRIIYISLCHMYHNIICEYSHFYFIPYLSCWYPFQLLMMTTGEKELLSRHLAHNLKTHDHYYRLQEASMSLTKMSRLLIATEEGDLSKYVGKKLEDIDITGKSF